MKKPNIREWRVAGSDMLCRGGRHTYRAMSITGSADRSRHISSLPPKTQPHSYSACWWITSSASVDSSTIVSRFFLEVLLRVHCTIIECFFSVVSRFESSARHDFMISSSPNLCRVLATGRLGGRMHHMAWHSLWIKILVSSFTVISLSCGNIVITILIYSCIMMNFKTSLWELFQT